MAKTSIELALETKNALDAKYPGHRPVLRLNGTNFLVTTSDHVTEVIEFTDGPYTAIDLVNMRTALRKDHNADAKIR